MAMFERHSDNTKPHKFERHSDNTKPHKFYLAMFTHKTTKRVIYKFGKTMSKDVMDRLDWTRYPEDRAGYKDFDIKVVFSMWAKNEAKAEEYEDMCLNRFTRYDINDVVGTPIDTYTWKNMTGISEFRPLSRSDYNKIISELYKLKRNEDVYTNKG